MAQDVNSDDPNPPGVDCACDLAVAYFCDPEVTARYPERAELIGADIERFTKIARTALSAGHPVVVVFPDGGDIVLHPGDDVGQFELHADRPAA